MSPSRLGALGSALMAVTMPVISEEAGVGPATVALPRREMQTAACSPGAGSAVGLGGLVL